MQNDKKMPMTRIQERAPENKWMKDAKVPPGPVGQHGVIDATMLGDIANPPRPEGLPERGAGRVDAQQVPILEKEKEVLEAQKSEALQDAHDSKAEADALGEQLQQMRGDLKQSNADNEVLKKKIVHLEADRREDADNLGTQLASAQEKVREATTRIEELEAAQPEPVETEVEVYPRKVTLSEVTNARQKNDLLLVKGTVVMGEDEEDHSILLRIPYSEVVDILKGE